MKLEDGRKTPLTSEAWYKTSNVIRKIRKKKKYKNYSVKKFRNKRLHTFYKKSLFTKKNILITKNMDYFGIILKIFFWLFC